MYKYKTRGTCSTTIEIETNGDVIEHVQFSRGCEGNLSAISRLVEGMKVDDAIARLSGIACPSASGGTSCPDQLARALASMPRS